MRTVRAQLVGEMAVIPRSELEDLVQLAGRSEPIDLQVESGELSSTDLMRLAEQGGAFDFWREAGEEVYTAQDGEPLCRRRQCREA